MVNGKQLQISKNLKLGSTYLIAKLDTTPCIYRAYLSQSHTNKFKLFSREVQTRQTND